MSTIELKEGIHKIVDGIGNPQFLQTLYDFLKTKVESEPGQMWDTLNDTQKQEVLSAYDESEDEANLVAREKIFGKIKWRFF